jgi:hypothetical protein
MKQGPERTRRSYAWRSIGSRCSAMWTQ